MADLQKYTALEYTSNVLAYLCATIMPLYVQTVGSFFKVTCNRIT